MHATTSDNQRGTRIHIKTLPRSDLILHLVMFVLQTSHTSLCLGLNNPPAVTTLSAHHLCARHQASKTAPVLSRVTNNMHTRYTFASTPTHMKSSHTHFVTPACPMVKARTWGKFQNMRLATCGPSRATVYRDFVSDLPGIATPA